MYNRDRGKTCLPELRQKIDFKVAIPIPILTLIFVFIIANINIDIGTAATSGARDTDSPVVYVLQIEGTITEGTAMDVLEGLAEAEDAHADAILIELDTPGGLVESTLKITEAIMNSKVPVITYVTPRGAIAASAGSFILVSGNIAAMTPGTTTGAAMPVSIGVSGREPADEKTVKFFAGHIASIANSTGKNATQAKLFVTENAVLNADEALQSGVIDIIASDESELLRMVDGREVSIDGNNITMRTRNASLHYKGESTRSYLLKVLGNPQIAVILLIVGLYGLIFGFMSPGTYVPEMIGAICLVLSLYGMGLFSVNMFGVLLIIIAVILFIAEALTPTFGILTTGAVVCLIIGALILPKEPLLFNPRWFQGFAITILGIAVASAAFFFFAVGAVLKARRRRPKVGAEELIGRVTKAMTNITEDGGTIKIHGELWNARTRGEEIEKGAKVEVVAREGLTLIVRRANDRGA